jgi:hypothetical protein
MSDHVVLTEELWRRLCSAIVRRVYQLGGEGILTPPITATVSEVESDGDHVCEFVFPDLEGGVQVRGPFSMAPIFLPLRIVSSDLQVVDSCVFEIPPILLH